MANSVDPIASMLEQLASPDEASREGGLEELEKLRQSGVSADVAARLLEAAANIKSVPTDIPGYLACHLIEAASESVADCLPVIQRNFDLYEAEAQTRAIAILGEAYSAEALTAFWSLVEPRLNDPSFRLYPRTIDSLAERADATDLPLLEKLAENLPDNSLNAIISILLGHFRSGWLAPEEIARHTQPLQARCMDAFAELSRKQEAPGVAWMWTDAHLDIRLKTWIFGFSCLRMFIRHRLAICLRKREKRQILY